MNQSKATFNWSFALPWLIYLPTLAVFISLLVVDYSRWNIPTWQVIFTYNLLLTGCIIAALSSTIPRVNAFIYTFYWLLLGIIFEYLYINNGLLIHYNRSTFILEIVPVMIVFQWLTLFFVIYSCSTFFSFFIKAKSLKNTFLIRLGLDGVVMFALTFLFEPIGHKMGFWSWDRGDYGLIFNIPIIVFIEYFIGIMVIMLPIRWIETYKNVPKKDIYGKWFNFSIFMIFIFLLQGVLFANSTGLTTVRLIAIIYILLFSGTAILQMKKIRKSSVS
jgi:hypothetical protein